MTFALRLGEGERDSGPDADHGGLLDAKPARDRVRRLEPDAANILGKTIGVLGHDLHGLRPICLIDADRPRRAGAMRMQKDHDFAHDLLFGPGGNHAGGANGTDAADLAKPARLVLDNFEDFVSERLDQPFRIDRSDAADHAGGEVFLYPIG